MTDLFYPVRTLPQSWMKRFHQESSSRDEETIHILLVNFSIFVKMTVIWPLIPTFWARSKFNSIANFDLVMENNSLLKLSNQEEFVSGLLAGGRHTYKNNNLVQGKQTVGFVKYQI